MTPRMVQASARLAGSTVLATQSDERLVALSRHGNERAFEALVERYRGPLLRYCGKLLPNSRAEDAVQQAFLNAHTAITNGEIDEELNFRPWLYKIAHNASLNLLRQNGWKYDQLSEDFDGASRLMFNAFAFDFRKTDEFYATLIQPSRQATERLKRIGLMRLDDDTNAFDGGEWHVAGV